MASSLGILQIKPIVVIKILFLGPRENRPTPFFKGRTDLNPSPRGGPLLGHEEGEAAFTVSTSPLGPSVSLRNAGHLFAFDVNALPPSLPRGMSTATPDSPQIHDTDV